MTSMTDEPKSFSEPEVRELWQANAPAWGRGVSQRWDFFRYEFHDPVFLPLLGKLDGTRFLDLACGEGVLSRWAASQGATVTGVDISAELIAQARQGVAQTSTRFHTGSISHMPFLRDHSFDRAACVMALMDTPKLPPIFMEIARVLAPGGTVAISTSHPLWDRPGTRWEEGEKGPQLGTYFTKDAWIDEWSFRTPEGGEPQTRPFRIATFPHTISDYLNAGAQAGLRLEKVLEPLPPTACSPEHDAVFERWRHTPFYLMTIWRAGQG